MAELSLEDRCKLAATFITQSPPGEVNDVINDIRAIIADDEALMPHVLAALREYNLAQLYVVEHGAGSADAHASLLSAATRVPGSSADRFVDAAAARAFTFDHLTLAVTNYAPHRLPADEESFRAELATSLAKYAKNHFATGTSSVACSQYPLVEPRAPAAPAAPEPEAAAEAAPPTPAAEPALDAAGEAAGAVASGGADGENGAASTDGAASTNGAGAEGAVTDVVSELVGAGEAEPAPTPAVADVPGVGADESVRPESLDKVDEAVEEEKDKEESEDAAGEAAAGEEAAGEDAAGEAGQPDAETAAETGVEADAAAGPVVEESEAEAGDAAPAAADAVPEPVRERVENPVYTLEIVGNKYNPNNFWTGRWRTCWVVDPAKKVVDGTITVDVHYYEQGNVQLAAKHEASFALPEAGAAGQSVASQVVSAIAKIEATYQLELNEVYGDLGDKAFRALRRALPVTRQKVDWDKVGGYTLGADLSKARG